MKYNAIKLSVLVLYWSNLVFGQNIKTIDCLNEELVTSIFNDPIDLNMRGTIKMYENVTINKIISTTNNEFQLNYIDARLEDANNNQTKNLVLFTTEHFDNYAKEQMAARISLKIILNCGMGKERVVIFFQPLKEGNYFSPIFAKSSYELLIPTPIFAGFDLTAFLEITAKDDDLTHNQIIFTSNDSLQHHISVGTKNVTSADKKTYFADLTLEKILLELPQPIQFEIIATDSGDPPKSSSAFVIIRSDPKRSLPPKPKFARTLYKGLINFNFTMEPIQIKLVNGTYTSSIEFSLTGLSTEGFYLQDNKNGYIDITWNYVNLNRSKIMVRKTWELVVKAEHKNLAETTEANVLVELAKFQNYFHFISSYYEGNIDELGELHIIPIIFNPYTYQHDMDFKLQSLYNFFNLSIQNFNIQLQLTNNFTWQVNNDIGYIKLTLQASWENLSAITHIVIKLPQTKNATPQQTFQFEKPLYVGQLNETHVLEMETIEFRTDVNNTQEIQYNLNGNFSDQFHMLQNENRIEIKTMSDAASNNIMKSNSLYLLVLEAKYNDLKAYASVAINGPQGTNKINSKIFLTSLAKGTILITNSTQDLSMEYISIAGEFQEKFSNLKFFLKGEYSLHFEVKEKFLNRSVEIVLKTPISANILVTQHFLNMSLEAMLPGLNGVNDTVLILIEFPMKECPKPVSTTSDPPKFFNTKYIFTAYTNQTGILGGVDAFRQGENITFHYSLDVESDLLVQHLTINRSTGELLLNDTIDEGSYIFNITVENVESRERTIVGALLKVQPTEKCPLLEGVAVEKTLMIRHIDEEKPFHGLLNLKYNKNCTFHIVDMWPNDKEYVHVNYIFTMLDSIAIDREDEIFQNMSEPQVIVKLRLECSHEDKLNNLTIDIPQPIETRETQIQFIEDIPYSPDIMWLYIKIDDINDNAPEFIFNEGPVYLGYPAGNADFEIYPEYLTQIEAFDKDLDFNAKIKFTMRDNHYFDIEPETGKIYPKGKVLEKDEQTELIILAVDQYGEGLVAGTVVIVKALTPDFYSLVTLKENSTRTKQEVERDLSDTTGYNINIIKMSFIPQTIQIRSSVEQSLNCKAWVYAYSSHQLVPSKTLKEQILVKNPQANIENIESYDMLAFHSPLQTNTNLVYLIATIILSMISCSSLTVIIWRFYYKSTLNTKCDTKTSASSAASNNDNEQQEICVECSHGLDNAKHCTDCSKNNVNHVKFSDLVENVIVDEYQST